MIIPKRQLGLARKWMKVTALGKKRLSSKIAPGYESGIKNALIASKGHFVVYTMDGWRFELPLSYLSSNVFQELFRISEDLFGFPRDEPITLPCDAIFMESTIAHLLNRLSKCSALHLVSQGHRNNHELLQSF